MTQTTLKTLFDRNVLAPGDTLVMNRQRLRTKPSVSEAVVRRRNEFEFWRCRITKRSPETHRVRYLLDDDHYGLASLANQIAERLTDEDSHVHITSQEDYWRHPSFGNRTLWELLIDGTRSDRDRTDTGSK